MYKGLSQNIQRGASRKMPVMRDGRQKANNEFQSGPMQPEGRWGVETRLALDPANRSRICKWNLMRFDVLGASFSAACSCGHATPHEAAEIIAKRFGMTAAAKLNTLRTSAHCPSCQRQGIEKLHIKFHNGEIALAS